MNRGITVAVVSTLVGFSLPIVNAIAHSWYMKYQNPVTMYGCCSGVDCKPVAKRLLVERPGGILFLPTNEFIPDAEILHSEDHDYHRCEFEYGDKKGKTRCFFRPVGSV